MVFECSFVLHVLVFEIIEVLVFIHKRREHGTRPFCLSKEG